VGWEQTDDELVGDSRRTDWVGCMEGAVELVGEGVLVGDLAHNSRYLVELGAVEVELEDE
jgi:hypothetical protein